MSDKIPIPYGSSKMFHILGDLQQLSLDLGCLRYFSLVL